MKRHYYFVPLLLVLTVAACHSTGDSGVHAANLDQEIQLAPGERAAFGSQRLDVEFVRVLEDSRCPSDTTCVWAGEVKVQLATRTEAAAAVQHEITAGQHATIGELRLVVVQVEPEPISTRQISPAEYRVNLKVERVEEQ